MRGPCLHPSARGCRRDGVRVTCWTRWGKVTSIYGDLPYGIGLPNFVIDPNWNEGTVRSIAAGCHDLAHPDHCVVMLGVGSARQGVQWADSLQSTGFRVEKHLRMTLVLIHLCLILLISICSREHMILCLEPGYRKVEQNRTPAHQIN